MLDDKLAQEAAVFVYLNHSRVVLAGDMVG